MAFSAFSQPLNRGMLGSYIGGGAAVGAGAGALLAGRDHRTSGAVVGGIVGGGTGTLVSAAHAFSGESFTGARSVMHRASAIADMGAGGVARAGRVARTAVPMAGKTVWANANITSEMRSGVESAVAKVAGIMGRFRKG